MMYAYRLFLPYLPSLVLISLPALSEPASAHDPAPGATDGHGRSSHTRRCLRWSSTSGRKTPI
jgi:hypothetical protein